MYIFTSLKQSYEEKDKERPVLHENGQAAIYSSPDTMSSRCTANTLVTAFQTTVYVRPRCGSLGTNSRRPCSLQKPTLPHMKIMTK